MKKRLRSLMVFVALLVGLTPNVLAQETSSSDVEKIYTYASVDGLADSIVETSNQRKEMLQAQLNSDELDEEQKKVLQKVIDLTQPEKIVQDIKVDFTSSFDEQYVDPILAWYESPLGQKVMAIDQQNDPDEEAFTAFLEDENNYPDDRVNVLAEILEASEIYALMVDMSLSSETGMSDANIDYAQKLLDSGEITTEEFEELKQGLGAKMESLTTQMQTMYDQHYNMMLSMALYMYRDLSLEELQQMNEFYQSDAGTYLYSLISDLFVQAIYDYTYNVGYEMAKFTF